MSKNSGKKAMRRARGGEIKASMFGVKQPERETFSSCQEMIIRFHKLGNGVGWCVWETCARSRTNLQGTSWTTTIPCASANCLWLVLLPAGIIISLIFCRLPGINETIWPREGLCQFFTCFSNSTLVALPGMKYWIVLELPGEEGNVFHGRSGRTRGWRFFVYLLPRWFEMVLTQCDSRTVLWMPNGEKFKTIEVERQEKPWQCDFREANDWRNREHVVLDLVSNLKMWQILWTSRASDNYVVSRKLAMRHEPGIASRCCSTCSKITSFPDEKRGWRQPPRLTHAHLVYF